MKLTRLIAIALPLAATVMAMGQNNAYAWTRTDADRPIRHAIEPRHASFRSLRTVVGISVPR